MRKPTFSSTALAVAVAGTLLVFVLSVGVRARQAGDGPGLHTVHVQGNVYMIVGAGANVAFQVGENGVLVVDTGTAAQAPAVLAEIKKVANRGQKIRWIFNTTLDADHVGGNAFMKKAGEQIVAGNFAGQVAPGGGAAIVARQELLEWMSEPAGSGSGSGAPSDALPTDAYSEGHTDFFFNGEAVMAIHSPPGRTAGDSLVFFRRSDVLVTGDAYIQTTFPVIDTGRGGTINGVIAGLNRIIDITVPDQQAEDGTLVIGGHGRLSDEADVVDYRDMVTIIRDRVQDMVRKGMTLDQVIAARPAQDYEQRYGSTTGPWTTTQFIRAVYETLKPVVTAATSAKAGTPPRAK